MAINHCMLANIVCLCRCKSSRCISATKS